MRISMEIKSKHKNKVVLIQFFKINCLVGWKKENCVCVGGCCGKGNGDAFHYSIKN